MSTAVRLRTGEDGVTQTQTLEERVRELEEQNCQLKAELKKLTEWPEGVENGNWRGRALAAEKKLETAYARMRLLNEQITELKGTEL